MGFRPARQAARAARARGAAGAGPTRCREQHAEPAGTGVHGALGDARGVRGARGWGGAGGAGFVLLGLSAFVLRGGPGCSPCRVLQGGEGQGDREGWGWRVTGTERDGDREMMIGRDEDREGWRPGGTATGRDSDREGWRRAGDLAGAQGRRLHQPGGDAVRGVGAGSCGRGPAPQHTWGFSPTLPQPRCPLTSPRPGVGAPHPPVIAVRGARGDPRRASLQP